MVDNMEHLVERAPLLARLLAGAPGLHVLVTSRMSLGLYGEHQVRVPPLRLPGAGDGGRRQRGGAAVPAAGRGGRFWVRARWCALAAAAAICAAVDGLPLAIELAAAWVQAVSAAGAAAITAGATALLTGGPRDRAAAAADAAGHLGVE